MLESIRAGRADGTLTRADNGALGGALRLAEALDVIRAGADYGTAFANVAGQFRHTLTACGLTPAARASRDAESLDELDALLAGLDTPTAPRSTEAPSTHADPTRTVPRGGRGSTATAACRLDRAARAEALGLGAGALRHVAV